jgi:hypothetical protein
MSPNLTPLVAMNFSSPFQTFNIYALQIQGTSYLTNLLFHLSIGLDWNQVHYYCGHLLAYCTSPGSQTVMTMEQLVDWLSGRGNRSTRRKTCPSAALSTRDSTWLHPGSNQSRHGNNKATNRLTYVTDCMYLRSEVYSGGFGLQI